jgi:hypothetical protein
MASTISTTTTATVRFGARSSGELAGLTNEEILAALRQATRVQAAADGEVAQLGAEVARRQAFRDMGATSLEGLLAGHHGLGTARARTLARVGERLFDLPRLQEALSAGELSLDQARVMADVACPDTDSEWVEAARGLPVRDLVALAERRRVPPAPSASAMRGGPTQGSLRFNDRACTMTAQLRRVDYASVRAAIEARVAAIGADGTTPLDVRSADALVSMLAGSGSRSASGSEVGTVATAHASPPTLVAHVPFRELMARSGRLASSLVGELQRAGLISIEVLERLACDVRLVVALDDDAGHTMYEGRARRFPSETQRREMWRRDRHCRFPGCANAWFTHAHHIVPWSIGGLTDTDNLVTLCVHHHHEVHSKRWSVSGDANAELTFAGPGNRVMTSPPSPLWGTIGAATTEGGGGSGGGVGRGSSGGDGGGPSANDGGGPSGSVGSDAQARAGP